MVSCLSPRWQYAHVAFLWYTIPGRCWLGPLCLEFLEKVIIFIKNPQRKDAAEKMNPLGVKLGESGLQNHF